MVPADGDFGRSGTYPVSGVPQNAAVAWRASIEASVQVAPVLAGGLLIVGDQTGMLYVRTSAGIVALH